MTRKETLSAAQCALLEGNVDRAEYLYRDVLREDARNPEALDGLGILCCQRGETGQGIDFFQDALRFVAERTPASADTTIVDTTADDATGVPEECRRHREAQATLLFHLGLAQRSAGQREEAIQSLRWSHELASETPEILLNLGQLYFELERHAEAAETFATLTDKQPDNASAWLTLGYIQALRNQNEEAVRALETALALDPNSPECCFHLAETLRKSERYEESLPYYQRLLQVATEWPQAICGYGKSLLALGHLGDGWDALEFRLACVFGSWERHLLPNWDGTFAEDETVLAYSEEGTSADLMFASCLPDLINTVDHCVIECDESLHNLFRRSFPRASIVGLTGEPIGAMHIKPPSERNPSGVVHPEQGRKDNPWGYSIDRQIAFGSMPRYFRREKIDFPLRKAYLVPDRDRVQRWSLRLAEIGAVAKVGVLWQGSWTAETERQTALPLPELRNLMLKHQGDAAWVCLQHGSRQKDIDVYRRNVSLQLHLFKEAFQYDLDAMAALIASLDLVVTPPGYVAHLAGALGVRTWLVLTEQADWRWNLGSNGSLWYPSFSVYRQQTGQVWSELFEGLETDLDRFLANYRPPEEEAPQTIAFPGYARSANNRDAAETVAFKIRRAG